MRTDRYCLITFIVLLCATAATAQVTMVSGDSPDVRRAGLRFDGPYLDVGYVSPTHGEGAFSLGAGAGLGTLFTRHLDFSLGVRGWSSDIDRSAFGSSTGGQFSDYAMQADFTLPLMKIKGLRPYVGTGVTGHLVGADIPADRSLEDALSGFKVGTQAVFGLATVRQGWGVRAQVRRDFVEDIGGTTFSVGVGWWPKSRAQAATSQRVQVIPAGGTDVVTYAPGNAPTQVLDRSYDAEAGPTRSDLVRALNHLKQENRIIRTELDSLRRNVAVLAAERATPAPGPIPSPAPATPLLEEPRRRPADDLGRALASLTMPAGKGSDGVSYVVQPRLRFDNGGTELSLDAREELRRVASVILRYPDAEIEVQGHTDSRGPLEVNQSLSERRALSVRQELIGLGLTPVRVRAVGYGPALPVADNSTADGRARNRRVDLVITLRDGS